MGDEVYWGLAAKDEIANTVRIDKGKVRQVQRVDCRRKVSELLQLQIAHIPSFLPPSMCPSMG